MSGGIAYVLDESGQFAQYRCNKTSVGLEQVFDPQDQEMLQTTIYRHFDATGSPRARWILENWNSMLPKFVKVFPHEFKRVMKKNEQHETVSRRVMPGESRVVSIGAAASQERAETRL
jgi:glutamate synthase domain-containing protein 3